MPELPEVETTRLGILPLVGKVVSAVEIRFPTLRWPIPPYLTALLPQQTLRSITRRAKYILCEFDTGILILHLGMSGHLSLLDDIYPPEKHDHFDLIFHDKSVLRLHDPRRFGAVLWMDHEDDGHVLLNRMGPEPLSDDFNAQYLKQALSKKSLAIKNAIMDGHIVVGVGNIYASESLFRARIHPQTPANQVSTVKLGLLVAEIQSTLRDALEAGGSSLRDFFNADGKPGYFQQSYCVYGRTGEACKVCQKPIACMRLGQRSTFYCAKCQPIKKIPT